MREIAEKEDKSRPKPALRSTHAGNGMKKKKRSSVFTACFPGEVTRAHSYVVRRMEGATSTLWWIKRSECNYSRSEYFRSALCIGFRCTRAASLPEKLYNPRLERKVERHEQCFHNVFFACVLLSHVQGSRPNDQVYETEVYPASERELLLTKKNLLVFQEVISRLS